MDHERFRDSFSRVDELTAAQRKEVAAVLRILQAAQSITVRRGLLVVGPANWTLIGVVTR